MFSIIAAITASKNKVKVAPAYQEFVATVVSMATEDGATFWSQAMTDIATALAYPYMYIHMHTWLCALKHVCVSICVYISVHTDVLNLYMLCTYVPA